MQLEWLRQRRNFILRVKRQQEQSQNWKCMACISCPFACASKPGCWISSIKYGEANIHPRRRWFQQGFIPYYTLQHWWDCYDCWPHSRSIQVKGLLALNPARTNWYFSFSQSILVEICLRLTAVSRPWICNCHFLSLLWQSPGRSLRSLHTVHRTSKHTKLFFHPSQPKVILGLIFEGTHLILQCLHKCLNLLHCGLNGTNSAFGKRSIRLTLGGTRSLVNMLDQNCWRHVKRFWWSLLDVVWTVGQLPEW